MRAPVAPARIDRAQLHALEIGSRSNREHTLGCHAAALDRDPAIGLVGRDRYVGRRKSQALQQDERAPDDAAMPELSLVKLRAEVVMVENQLLAEQVLEKSADK